MIIFYSIEKILCICIGNVFNIRITYISFFICQKENSSLKSIITIKEIPRLDNKLISEATLETELLSNKEFFTHKTKFVP